MRNKRWEGNIKFDCGLQLSFWRSRMISRLSWRPIGSVLLGSALCFGTAAFAQDTSTATNASANQTAKAKNASSEDEHPDLVEIDPFGGVSIWGNVARGLNTKLADGGLGGLRLAV